MGFERSLGACKKSYYWSSVSMVWDGSCARSLILLMCASLSEHHLLLSLCLVLPRVHWEYLTGEAYRLVVQGPWRSWSCIASWTKCDFIPHRAWIKHIWGFFQSSSTGIKLCWLVSSTSSWSSWVQRSMRKVVLKKVALLSGRSPLFTWYSKSSEWLAD